MIRQHRWVFVAVVILIASGICVDTARADDVQVNTYTTSFQARPSVASDAGGRFVIVWESYGSSGTDASGYSIQAQRYALSGSAVGGEFQVNTYTTNTQYRASVALDADGDFVVVWDSYGSSGTDASIFSIQGQRFASNGSAVGGEFQVNTYTTTSQFGASVALDADGDFVIVWTSLGSGGTDASGHSIQGQRYASDGSPAGGEFQVNTYTTSGQYRASVALDADGDFVVVWDSLGSSGTDASGFSIQGQRYASDGSPAGGQFQVNSYTMNGQSFPSVALDADGDFVVVWDSVGSYGTDSSDASIQGQRYASDGSAAGGQFQVNTSTTDDQYRPSVALSTDGDFVVAWDSLASSGTDTSTFSIQGQRYTSAGFLLGPEFQVNSYTTSSQSEASVSIDADGFFVVAWESLGSGGTDTDGASAQRSGVLLICGELIFADGFESGDVSAWTTTIPRRGGCVPNAPPAVTINMPADGSCFAAGTSIDFDGTAIDAEDGVLTASLSWDSDMAGSIGSGGSFSTVLLVGTHTVTASVTDSGGLMGSAMITVTVSDPPNATINMPLDGSSFPEGMPIDFDGTASDPEDGDLTGSLIWTSDLDGVFGSGGSFSTVLSVGTHTVTASVTDSCGLVGSHVITVTVNAFPVVDITSPPDDSTFPAGTSIDFVATATDMEDGDLTASIVWTSSLDGVFGFGGSASASLSVGIHTVTASVTDSGGLVGSDAITVTITPNDPPGVVIASPVDGASFPEGTPIAFSGSASDPQDGDITGGLSWTSDLDGVFGAGGSFSTTLSVGTHAVTASVTDSGGLMGSDEITVTVTAGCTSPSVTIDFDGLAPGTVVTTQFPEASFSSDPGADVRVVAIDLGSSPPNIVCTEASTDTCLNSVFVDFTDPAHCLTFKGVGAKASGEVAAVRVVQISGETTVPIVGLGVGTTPIDIDLTAFSGVFRIEIMGVSDPSGIGWDDFNFDIASN